MITELGFASVLTSSDDMERMKKNRKVTRGSKRTTSCTEFPRDGLMDRRTDGMTDRQNDGLTDGRTKTGKQDKKSGRIPEPWRA